MAGRQRGRVIAFVLTAVSLAASGPQAAPAAKPERRGPVVTGTVLAADGKPAAAATVCWFMRLAGGTISSGGAKVAADGTYALPHPRADDLSEAMEPTQLIMWATQKNEASAPIINRSGAVTVQMRAYDPTRLAEVQVVALDGATPGRWGGDLQVLLAPGRVGARGPQSLKAGRALELADVIPGAQAFLLFDASGFHVGDEISIEAGKRNLVEMPFEIEIPEGRVGASLVEQNGRVIAALVVPGSPAQRAGLKMGDELVTIDGRPAADVKASQSLLQGKAGEAVRVTVRRDQGTQDLQMRRSGPSAPRRAVVRARPLDPPDPVITAAAAFIPARDGERLVDVAPLHTSSSQPGEPFGVRVPEGAGLFEPLRVIVDFGDTRFYRGDGEAGIPIVLTAKGPGDFELRKEFSHYNRVRDPLGRGHDVSTGGPVIGFEPGELDVEGVYRLTVSAPGRGDVERTFRVTGPFTEQVYHRHQHRRIGSYEMRTRAVLELQPSESSSDKAHVFRAVFTSGEHTIEVDMIERLFGREVQDWFLTGAPWPTAREVVFPLRRRAFKLHRTDGEFVAAWPSGSLVVRVRGTRWGKDEEQLVDHYIMFYESKWVREGRQ